MSTEFSLTPQAALELMRTRPVFVAGAGVAGQGIIAMLRGIGGQFLVIDDRAENADLNTTGAVARLQDASARPGLVITSPGWRPDAPLLRAAAEAAVPVIGDVEAAWLADQAGAFGAPRTWIAITGTNGKTTATAMATEMLRADGRTAVSVGNIGTPPGAALVAEERADYLVAEVSSFQLHWAPSFTPDAGVVLNLAEDHLDWHGSMQGYASDKIRALRGPRPVTAVDDELLVPLAQRHQIPNTAAYSLKDPADVLAEGSFGTVLGVVDAPAGRVITEVVMDAEAGPKVQPIATAEGISPPGPAGIADAVAAAALVRFFGVSAEAIANALASFQVQAHRGQVVSNARGIEWVDNSKATNPHAAEAALRGMKGAVWVAGGQLKGAEVSELVSAIGADLRGAVVLGCDRAELISELNRQFPQLPVVDISIPEPEAAMSQAVAEAAKMAEPGTTVVLAPAAASLDMYTGMAQRGELFASYARQLAAGDGENPQQKEGHGNTGQEGLKG